MNESVDRRILGAFVCLDAITQNGVAEPLSVTTSQWTVKPNRSGIYVIFDGPGFDSLTSQFIPSGAWPAAVSFEVTLQDPNRRYLARRASLNAPLGLPGAPPAAPGSANVFNPQAISLYPAPSAPVGPNWAVIRASVTRAGTTPPQGLPWAIVQVTEVDTDATGAKTTTVLATGQTDANGEALLATIGSTTVTNKTDSGQVTLPTRAVTVTAYFDPGVLNTPPGWIPDPDELLTHLSSPPLKSSSQSAQLGSGQELPMSFAISV